MNRLLLMTRAFIALIAVLAALGCGPAANTNTANNSAATPARVSSPASTMKENPPNTCPEGEEKCPDGTCRPPGECSAKPTANVGNGNANKTPTPGNKNSK